MGLCKENNNTVKNQTINFTSQELTSNHIHVLLVGFRAWVALRKAFPVGQCFFVLANLTKIGN